MQAHLENLRVLASRHAGPGTVDTAIPGLAITMARQTTQPAIGMFQPRFCLVLQGAKEVMIGERRMRYDPSNYFIASLEVPATGCIIQASASDPYIGLSMVLEPEALAALLAEMPAAADSDVPSFAVNPVTAQLLDPCVRLLSLLDTPADIPVLASMLQREIL